MSIAPVFSRFFSAPLQTKAGCEVTLRSATPRWIDERPSEWQWVPYRGFVVTHGEVETISTRLGKQVKVAFVYRVCDDGRRSLAQWGHKRAPRYEMMKGTDMVDDQGAPNRRVVAIVLTLFVCFFLQSAPTTLER